MTRYTRQFGGALQGGVSRRLMSLLVLVMAVLLGGLKSGDARAAELIMFNEAGCVWCQRFDAEIGPIYAKTAEGRLAPLRRVDIAQARSSGFDLARPVTATPTFVLIEAGREVGRITGYPGEDFFWGLLDEMLAKLKPVPKRALRDASRVSFSWLC